VNGQIKKKLLSSNVITIVTFIYKDGSLEVGNMTS